MNVTEAELSCSFKTLPKIAQFLRHQEEHWNQGKTMSNNWSNNQDRVIMKIPFAYHFGNASVS